MHAVAVAQQHASPLWPGIQQKQPPLGLACRGSYSAAAVQARGLWGVPAAAPVASLQCQSRAIYHQIRARAAGANYAHMCCAQIQTVGPIHWLHPRAIMVATLYDSIVLCPGAPKRLLDCLLFHKSLIRYQDPHPGMAGWQQCTTASLRSEEVCCAAHATCLHACTQQTALHLLRSSGCTNVPWSFSCCVRTDLMRGALSWILYRAVQLG